ncbi:MAG TPA: VWA domain-containing protein, partial [Hanamia sp.]|nr:VWA domain-containing protein [Hanamia sp.]
TEMGSVLTFSAINNNDKVGVIFFSDKIEKYIPPKKGKEHALYIVRELLTATPKQKGTNLKEALNFFSRSNNQKSIAFIMSDFLDENYEHSLRVAGNRHDVIGVKVYDKMDSQLPDIGMVKVQDLESGNVQWLNTSDAMVRYNYHQNFINQSAVTKTIFNKAGAQLLHIRTDEDYVKILQQFFTGRKKTH